MKRIVCLIFILFLLAGCSGEVSLDRAMALRQKLQGQGCSFDTEITADYGDIQRTFKLRCTAESNGRLDFSVLQPESISGISGIISQSEGKLTFDDKAVAFELMAEGQLSPISAPWIMLKTLVGGYLSSCCQEDEMYHISIDDSYEADSLRLEVWVDALDRITYCEIYWQGRRLLSMNVENFTYV